MSLPNIISEINTIKSTYTPRSGTTMSGTLTFSIDNVLKQHDNISTLTIFGGMTANEGGNISLYGMSHSSNPGGFTIRANDGTTSKQLIAKPDGTFTWGGNNIITSAGGTMSSSLRRDGVSVSWRTILDNSPQSSFLYQNTYTGYMPALNLKTKDGRVGIGTYENYLALTYFLDTNTTNGANTQLNLLSNGTATIGGKQIVCVTKWTSGTSWYRVYSDGWIEQGGKASMPSTEGSITLHKAFSNTNYCVYGTSAGSTNTLNIEFKAKTTTMFYTDYAGTATGNYYWYACGY